MRSILPINMFSRPTDHYVIVSYGVLRCSGAWQLHFRWCGITSNGWTSMMKLRRR